MSNWDEPSFDTEAIARDVLKRIQSSLDTLDKPVSWLAATTGIPNVSLQRFLRNPGDFKLKQLIAIAVALEVDFGWLAFGTCPLCGGTCPLCGGAK